MTTLRARRYSKSRAATFWSAALLLTAIAPCACQANEARKDSAPVGAASAASAPGATPASAQPSSAQPSTGYKTYGAALGSAEHTTLADIAKNPEQFNAKTVLIEGEVRRACTRKGCWLELADSAAAEAPRCRVTFKDYAFFVPTDSAGAKARVQGTPIIKTVTASHVQHLESEGAQFSRKLADGSAEELTFIATGVELKKADG